MAVVIVTGSCGLVGSESARHYVERGYDVIGVDNDMRRAFFGAGASTAWMREQLERSSRRYRHVDADIRDRAALDEIFRQYGSDIAVVIHTAAQPSHDWAAADPQTDFAVNATGTLNLLECTRRVSPRATFIFMSTNKVYGDSPNRLPFVELDTRWELPADHPRFAGIDESQSIDTSTHSLFGVSKAAADLMVQEYGRYFGMNTVCFRAGCLAGPHHAGAVQHGFLAYLVKCAISGAPYTVFGYGGKQVRDNLHSRDLVAAFDAVIAAPRQGEVYNIGGSRVANCSIREAVAMVDEMSGRPLTVGYDPSARIGDHIWYITDVDRFRTHYPDWRPRIGVRELLEDIYEANVARRGELAGSP